MMMPKPLYNIHVIYYLFTRLLKINKKKRKKKTHSFIFLADTLASYLNNKTTINKCLFFFFLLYLYIPCNLLI